MTKFESPYHSNEWVKPITEEAIPILSQFSHDTAIELAAAVLTQHDTGDSEIPSVTVFPSDDKQQLGDKLLRTLQAPDYSTAAYNPDLKIAIGQIQQVLRKHGASGLLGTHAAYYLVRAAAGKENEPFLMYQDAGRKWPQYALDWNNKLTEQFGPSGYQEIQNAHPAFAEILGKTAVIAQLHYSKQGEIRQPGESVSDLIVRTAKFFDFSSIEGLQEANRVLGHGFEGYRKAAYHVRGLSYVNPSA